MTQSKIVAEQMLDEISRHTHKMNQLFIAFSASMLTVQSKANPTNLRELASMLVSCACDVTGITSQAFYSHKRSHRHCMTRFAVWHICKKGYPGATCVEMGKIFHRDNGAIIHGWNAAETMLDQPHEAEFRALVNGIEARFKQCIL